MPRAVLSLVPLLDNIHKGLPFLKDNQFKEGAEQWVVKNELEQLEYYLALIW